VNQVDDYDNVSNFA